MRVLLAHNYYQSSSPSGEDSVFHNEKKMLEENGIEIIEYTKHNDSLANKGPLSLLKTSYAMSWSRDTYSELAGIIKSTRPNIAHFHNTFPLITPSAYAACKDLSIPVIQTLHNYRLICPGALLQRGPSPCELCITSPQSLLPAFKYKCYRDSRLATTAVIRMLALNRHRKIYTDYIDKYIALTEFAASRFIKAGFSTDKLTVKNNFLPNPPDAGNGKGGYAVYVGRLGPEKGIKTLIEAWELSDQKLKLIIVGDGPLRNKINEIAQSKDLNIEFAGFKSKNEVLDIVADAVVQIIPSECYEGFPMVVLEALSCGTPIIASNIGSLAEIIKDSFGFKFTAGNAMSLADSINKLFNIYEFDNPSYNIIRCSARSEFDQNYTMETNFKQLLEIYSHFT